MSKGASTPLLPGEEGGLTSGPPFDPLHILGARLDRIEIMVKAIFEAFLGQRGPVPRDTTGGLLPFNPREYEKAMNEAKGGNHKALRAYLKKYEGKRGA